ncbi:hypothetical protein [Paludisphaera borealis]|uniref:Uncharacterized protein n=1 Tax=Paludisphaera borealis TaxID=1387353 RepID=A0A1U7CR76_9BACT|nr:hypothetical protein [Paludisphaera borealis]APW61408.1 hypothetical protein BSF38_02922 [Paludisphaera borealis]
MRTRYSTRPRLEPLEDRLALSGLTVATPNLSHQLQAQAQVQAQAQAKLQAKQQHAAEAAAQRASARQLKQLQQQQLKEQQHTKATAGKAVHPVSNSGANSGFNISKLWKSIFPW